jgi:Tol biopolymer transport system component
MRFFVTIVTAACATLAIAAQTQPPPVPVQPPDQTDRPIKVIITGAPGLPPKIAVPDFIALSGDPETTAAAKTIGQVLWDDLNFEREFYLIPRHLQNHSAAGIARPRAARSLARAGADAVIVGSVQKTGNGVAVQMKLVQVASGQAAMAKEYSGSIANPRLYAHTISDEVHQNQRALRGVARTKLAFTSDRAGESVKGPVGSRDISNIYISDYDGANQTRVTVSGRLTSRPHGRRMAGRWRTPATDGASRTSSFPIFMRGGCRIRQRARRQ